MASLRNGGHPFSVPLRASLFDLDPKSIINCLFSAECYYRLMKFIVLFLLPVICMASQSQAFCPPDKCLVKSHQRKGTFAAPTLNYEKVRALVIGISTEDEILKLFGEPTDIQVVGDSRILKYADSTTGAQRLTVTVPTSHNLISEILWIPYQGEQEVTLSGAKSGFKNALFREIPQVNQNSHSLGQAALYVDEISGVTIRYDKALREVEAIAIYGVNSRAPAKKE